ncbi:MAG: hypothetical protein F6J86_11915 [Symploca sp. SIO1B1]|nr:hypothetical protein [Symploca sp. SIO1C2]NER49447.1 hypothetical protein [Symploca sp. SIO1A3]NER94527.1 hypothetical protein [Symploca sp. SIO1B1]
MLVPLLLTLTIALAATCLSVNATDEIVKLAAVLTTILCIVFLLVVASIPVKLLIILTATVLNKTSMGDFTRTFRSQL